MKKSLRFFILVAFALLVFLKKPLAQVPQTFNYQGIARDAGGNVLPIRKIGIELSVLDGGPTGTVVYSETFTDTTNAFGLFSMQVGAGTVVSGSFAGINWASGNKYLQTSIDLSGGTSYTLSGTTQLLSVPYALYAQTAVVGNSSGNWSLSGNFVPPAASFLGTVGGNFNPLVFRVDSILSGVIDPLEANTFWGFNAGANGTHANGIPSGTANTGIGNEVLFSNTGSGNVGVGASALVSNVTGGNLTAIGTGADVSQDGLTNSTVIGAGAMLTASNMVQIGNTSVSLIQGQVPFTTPSDGRFKFNIREDVKGLDFILKLRPVTYQFNTKKEEDFVRGVRGGGAAADGASGGQPVAYNEAMMVRRTGFIAQDVERAAKKSGYDFDGLKVPKTDREYYSLSYASFVVPLVKAVQEQQEMIDELKQEIKELRQSLEADKNKKP